MQDSNKIWETKTKKSVFKTKIFEVNELDCFLPSKNIHNTFYSLHLYNWVNIFAITENNEVVLVKQHRIGSDIVTVEVPAGAIEHNEDPKEAAKRELEEETGYTCSKIELIKKIRVNPAIQDNFCYFYIATGCKPTGRVNLDDTEEIEIVKMSIDEVYKNISLNLIDNSLALMAVLLSKEYLQNHDS